MNPSLIEHLVFIGSSAFASPWNIAINESQRLAISADPTFQEKNEKAGLAGMRAARSIALLSYRNAATYNKTQQDEENKLENFRAISYQQYQGDKLVKRFNAFSYYSITRTFDTHNAGRERGGIAKALAGIQAKTLLIAISTDLLFYPQEIKGLQQYIHSARYLEIDSLYGHDGFLIETEQLTKNIKSFLSEKEYAT